MEQLEQTRPTYKGTLRRSPVTNKYEPYYPGWKRLLFRLFVTIPLLFVNLVLVSFCIVFILRLQIWINEHVKPSRSFCKHCFRLFLLLFFHLFILKSLDVINTILTENFTCLGNNNI